MPAERLTIPIPLRTRDDRRRGDRFVATMPVTVDGHPGTTQDLSGTGLAFTADQPYAPGARVEVTIEYLLDGHNYPLHCEAEVVRSTPCEGRWTIGARLLPQPQLVEVVPAPPPDLRPAGGARPRD